MSIELKSGKNGKKRQIFSLWLKMVQNGRKSNDF